MQLKAACSGDAQNYPEGLADVSNGNVWVVSALVLALYNTGGKSWVPPSTTATCLSLYPFFSACHVTDQPQPPSAVDQTAFSPSSLRNDCHQSHKLTKGKESTRRWRINTSASTGLIFKKAASKWSCEAEREHNATPKAFFCLPLFLPTSVPAKGNQGSCLGMDEPRMLHDVWSLDFNETMCQGKGFRSSKRGWFTDLRNNEPCKEQSLEIKLHAPPEFLPTRVCTQSSYLVLLVAHWQTA